MGQPSKTFLYLLLLYIILISREYIQRNPYQFFSSSFFQHIPKKKKKKEKKEKKGRIKQIK
jgi:hypothetical protein